MSNFGSEIDTDHSMDSEDFENLKPSGRSDDEFELSYEEDADSTGTNRVSAEDLLSDFSVRKKVGLIL